MSQFSTATSKPILKKRSLSAVMLTSLSANFLACAAQAVQVERQKEMEEEQRKNPLTPTHILRDQWRIRQKQRSTVFDSIARSSSSSGGQIALKRSRRIHFNDRVEQRIALDVKDYEENASIDESEDEELFMRPKHYTLKRERSTIAKLPATTLRTGDEPIYEPPQVVGRSDGFTSSGSDDDLAEFYYAEWGGFSSASPPEFPSPSQLPVDEDPIDNFSSDDDFASQPIAETIPGNTTSSLSSRRPSDLELEEESPARASLPIAIPSSHSTRQSVPPNRRGIMDEEYDDWIRTVKDLVGVLWNAGWDGRR